MAVISLLPTIRIHKRRIVASIRTARFLAGRLALGSGPPGPLRPTGPPGADSLRTRHPISVIKSIKAVWYTAVGLNQYIPEDISTITYMSSINRIRLACTIPDLEKALFRKYLLIDCKKKKMAPQLKNPHNKKTRK